MRPISSTAVVAALALLPAPTTQAVRVQGIDVSHFQGTIDWSAVAASGKQFAWCKATEGMTFDDPTFVTNMTAGAAAGLKMGGYHFARPDNNSAATEVAHYLAIAGPYIKAGYLVPALDVENPVQAGDVIDTKPEMSQWVNDWCNGVLAATGVRPLIYTYTSYATFYLDSSVTQWPLWMASSGANPLTTGTPSSTAPWSSANWSAWQYGTATVPGVTSGAVDVDVLNDNSPLAAITIPEPTAIALAPLVPLLSRRRRP